MYLSAYLRPRVTSPMVSKQHKYKLCDENGETIIGRDLHKIQRQMVHTMVDGSCHSARSDIVLPGITLTIPEGLNVFIHNSNVLLFGRLGRDTHCLMLFIQGGSPYIFVEEPHDVTNKITLLQKIKGKNIVRDLSRSIKNDRQVHLDKKKDHSSTESSDSDESGEPPVDPSNQENLYLQFYLGKYDIKEFKNPKGDYLGRETCRIDDILSWKPDDTDNIMEKCHAYIQWVFPNFEPSNFHKIPPLTEPEAQLIKADRTAMQNVLKVYNWFLAFLGATMKDKITGALYPADNFITRINNLKGTDNHNFLRITRILNWLHLMGYDHYMKPLYIFCRCHFQDSNDKTRDIWRKTFLLVSREELHDIEAVEDHIKVNYDRNVDKSLGYTALMKDFYSEERDDNEENELEQTFGLSIDAGLGAIEKFLNEKKYDEAKKIIGMILADWKSITPQIKDKYQEKVNRVITIQKQIVETEGGMDQDETDNEKMFRKSLESRLQDLQLFRTKKDSERVNRSVYHILHEYSLMRSNVRLKFRDRMMKDVLDEDEKSQLLKFEDAFNKYSTMVKTLLNENKYEEANKLTLDTNNQWRKLSYNVQSMIPDILSETIAFMQNLRKRYRADNPVQNSFPIGTFCWRSTSQNGKIFRSKVRVTRIFHDTDPISYECEDLNTGNHIHTDLKNLTPMQPSKFPAPLEVTWSKTGFNPSLYLRNKYSITESDDFNIEALKQHIKDDDVAIPDTEKYSYPLYWFDIANNTYEENGWLSDTVLDRLSEILCGMYGGITSQSTHEEIRKYIKDSKKESYETFVIINGDTYRSNLSTKPRELSKKSKGINVIDLTAFDNILVVMNTDNSNRATNKDVMGRPVGGSHWVLGRINVKNRTIGIYDSMNNNNQSKRNELNGWKNDTFLRLLRGEQYLTYLEDDIRTDVERKRLQECADDNNWTEIMYEVEKQNDSCACGVYSSINMAYLLSHHEPDMRVDINNDTLSRFRKWLSKILCEEEFGPEFQQPKIPDSPSEVHPVPTPPASTNGD
jgi:hypothetical protein